MAKKEKKPGFWAEFKAFISKGNVMSLAIGVVLGAAFNAIVNGFVNGIINPLISLAIGKASVEEWVIVLKPEVVDAVTGEVTQAATLLQYGVFIQAIINFLIIGLSLFVGMKIVMGIQNKAKKLAEMAKDKFDRKEEEAEEAAETAPVAETPAEPAPAPAPEVASAHTDELLSEIRDLLKAQVAESVAPAKKVE